MATEEGMRLLEELLRQMGEDEAVELVQELIAGRPRGCWPASCARGGDAAAQLGGHADAGRVMQMLMQEVMQTRSVMQARSVEPW